jgi:hypothetical protein
MNFRQKMNTRTGQFNLVPSDAIITFKPGVANAAALPTVGNTANDARITADNGHLYIWSGAAWVDQGDIIDVDWAALTNKPSSTVSDIDSAVSLKHTQNTDKDLVMTVRAESISNSHLLNDDVGNISNISPRGQTFISNISGNLTKIVVKLNRATGMTEDLDVQLLDVGIDGLPLNILNQTTIVYTTISEVMGEKTLTLSTPTPIEAGHTYAIIFSILNVSATDPQYVIAVDGADSDRKQLAWDGVGFVLTGRNQWYLKVYTIPLSGIVIEEGIIKESMGVIAGKTIDGRDISVDGAKLDGIKDLAVDLVTVKADTDIADAISKKHSNSLDHTQGTDQGLDTGGANAVVVADIKDAVTKKHSNSLDHSHTNKSLLDSLTYDSDYKAVTITTYS